MIRSIVLFLFAAFALTGCFEYESRIKVRPDGSGVLIETIKLNEETADFIRNIEEGMAADGTAGESLASSLFDEEELRQKAIRYGEGVSYVSGRQINENGKIGYVAVYAFTNIENLTVGQKNLTEQLPSGESLLSSSATGGGSPADRFTFAFARGNPSTLRIRVFPEEELRSHMEEKDMKHMEDAEMLSDSLQDSYLRMMKVFMEGMKMNFIVETEGTIVETNANYRKGSEITLLGIDFDALMSDDQALKKLMAQGMEMERSGRSESMEEIKSFIKNVPGFKAEFDEVVIKIKN